jgi:hypothetical protein
MTAKLRALREVVVGILWQESDGHGAQALT